MSARSNSVPANIAPYVNVLGVDDAVKLFLELGGCTVYLSGDPREGSLVTNVIGTQNAAALAKQLGGGHIKIPLARKWTAQALLAGGKGVAEIARTIRADESTVRRMLGPAPVQNQLSLFK